MSATDFRILEFGTYLSAKLELLAEEGQKEEGGGGEGLYVRPIAKMRSKTCTHILIESKAQCPTTGLQTIQSSL